MNEKIELYVDQFVGRQELLQEIDTALKDTSMNHAILLLGEGGMGKTALFRHVYRKYQADPGIVVVPLDMSKASGSNLGSIIEGSVEVLVDAGVLSSDDKHAIYQMYKPVLQAIDEGQSDSQLEKLQDKVYRQIFEYANFALEGLGVRLLILSDTLEATSLDILNRGWDLIGELNNCVYIGAGRPESAVKASFAYAGNIAVQKKWNRIGPIQLEGFSDQEVTDYFLKVLSTPLDGELVSRIALLAKRKPVLLALTAQWLTDNIQLPEEVNYSSVRLKALSDDELKKKQGAFEKELVNRVRDVRSPLDKAILALSFLDRRYDRRILGIGLSALGVNDTWSHES